MTKRRRVPRSRTPPLVLARGPSAPAGGAPPPAGGRGPEPGPLPRGGEAAARVVVGLVAAGDLDDHLGELAVAVRERRAHLARSQARAAAAAVEVGDRVRLSPHARPSYLRGATGTVVGWSGQRAVVALDLPTGQAIDREVRCPPVLLEVLPR